MTTLATVRTYDSFELRAAYIAIAVFYIVARIDFFRFTCIFAYFATRGARNIVTGLARFDIGEIASGHI
jgi:hypothetical protein